MVTIKSQKGKLEGHTIGICGDLKNGRTVQSLIMAMSRYKDVKFILISPKELVIPEYIKEEVLKRNNIFAKLSPIQKARIVRVLKQNGNVVGYMGDGINDSPALTNSDVGISVDTAVDIAKETADIILLEKDLNVLLDGVMERKKNICKFNEIYKNGNKLQLWGSSFSNYCKHCTTIFT